MSKVRELTDYLSRGKAPNQEEIKNVFSDIMSGGVDTETLKAFLLALKDKETPEIIAGAARAMREAMIGIDVRNNPDEIVLDTCGTGGGTFHTFNISTVAAFVIAGCNIKVAKHGNRAVSSKFGSADVLKELGLNLDIPPQKVAAIIKEIGIGFLFAPLYHPAMRYAAEARRQLATHTIFNILGPLCNPAGADTQIIGVYAERLGMILAKALKNLGTKRAFVIYSPKGLDEVSIEGKTQVYDLGRVGIQNYVISPLDFGLKEGRLTDIAPGKDSQENARIMLEILKGEKSRRTDTVLMNAALGIVASGRTEDLKQARDLAAESIYSGCAFKKLESLINLSK